MALAAIFAATGTLAGWYADLSAITWAVAAGAATLLVGAASATWLIHPTSPRKPDAVREEDGPEPRWRTVVRAAILMVGAAVVSACCGFATVYVAFHALAPHASSAATAAGATLVEFVWLGAFGARCFQIARRLRKLEISEDAALLTKPLRAGQRTAQYRAYRRSPAVRAKAK